MNLPETFVQSDTQRTVDHFNANAVTCMRHKKRPVLKWDGCWMIDCPDGCKLSDGSNHAPTSIIKEWIIHRGPVIF
jgi:hypothetical protein